MHLLSRAALYHALLRFAESAAAKQYLGSMICSLLYLSKDELRRVSTSLRPVVMEFSEHFQLR